MFVDVLARGSEYYSHNKWPRDRVIEYSNILLRDTIKNAYLNSRFYKNLYGSMGIEYGDLDSIPIEKLPIIDKDTVRDNIFDISTENISHNELDRAEKGGRLISRLGRHTLVHTSGSTGRPCSFLYDRNALDMTEANMFRISMGGKNRLGIRDFPIRTLYMASVGSGYASTALAMNGIKSYRSISLVVNAAEPIAKWKYKVKRFNPNYLAGYPSCIRILADMQENGEINLHPKKIITGGEPLSRETMEYFGRLFNADVMDYYGCTESIMIGMGASWYDGMYLVDDMNYTEVDEQERLIITPLYNKLFPLIRYRLNDVVEDFTRDQYGPLPYTHIKRVVGRSEEIMWFKNADGVRDFLHPLFIDDLDVEGIKEYQFVQTSDESLILKCVMMPNAPKSTEMDIKAQFDGFLRRKNLGNVRYSIDFVDKLDTDSASGKVKMVIDKTNALYN